jgi:hypothetical protein
VWELEYTIIRFVFGDQTQGGEWGVGGGTGIKTLTKWYGVPMELLAMDRCLEDTPIQ